VGVVLEVLMKRALTIAVGSLLLSSCQHVGNQKTENEVGAKTALSSSLGDRSASGEAVAGGDELVWPGHEAAESDGIMIGVANTLDLWRSLAQYKNTYLKSWRDELNGEAESESDIVDAFNELAYAITGPNGFWRKTLPKRWLGCPSDPDQEACKLLTKHAGRLAQWDKIQKKIEKLSPKQAKRFLKRNRRRLQGYIEMYVPDAINDAALRKTGFFRDRLSEAFK
jgi:hypothetical protein